MVGSSSRIAVRSASTYVDRIVDRARDDECLAAMIDAGQLRERRRKFPACAGSSGRSCFMSSTTPTMNASTLPVGRRGPRRCRATRRSACSIGMLSRYLATNVRLTTTARGAVRGVGVVEGPAGAQANAERVEVSGRDHAAIVSTSTFAPLAQRRWEREHREPAGRRERQPGADGGVRDARACSHALENARERLLFPLDRSRSTGNGIGAVSRFAGLVAAIGVDLRAEAARQQHAADHQHAGDGHLAGDDQRAHAGHAARGPRRPTRRCRHRAIARSRDGARAAAAATPHDDRRDRRQQQRERKHATVDFDRIDARESGGQQRRQRGVQRHRQRETGALPSTPTIAFSISSWRASRPVPAPSAARIVSSR